MESKEILVINWILGRLEKEGLLSRNLIDATLHQYKKLYLQDVNETEDNDYRKAA